MTMKMEDLLILFILVFLPSTSSSPSTSWLAPEPTVQQCEACLSNSTYSSPSPSSLLPSSLNCSVLLLDCSLCTSSLDCSWGSCSFPSRPNLTSTSNLTYSTLWSIEDDTNRTGLCYDMKTWKARVTRPDPVGKIISITLLVIFMAVVLGMCLRICAAVCSWRKCCVCQCSVSIHCCCEPKVPSLRVTPATGDLNLRQARETLAPTPPPSYLEIYPDPAQPPPPSPPGDVLPSRLLQVEEQQPQPAPFSLSAPNSPRSLRDSPTLPPSLLSTSASLGVLLLGDPDSEWASVASFPSEPFPEEHEDILEEGPITLHSSHITTSGRVFTLPSRPRISRPTTC